MVLTVIGARARRAAVIVIAGLGLSGCSSLGLDEVGTGRDPDVRDPIVSSMSRTGALLATLPPADREIDVAVYGYEDKTGQNEPEDDFSRFSRAVTQGADDVLYDILTEVADGGWFNVVERAGLEELLTERELIDETARVYRNATRSPLPPLRFAGIIIRGGVVDYDTNVVTGGAGARLLGIGMLAEHRRDRISVALRAVSVSTGEVLASVMTEKTIYSTLVQDSIFKYAAADEILELDIGVSKNEPTGIALRHTMELAVFALIVEGAEEGIWSFADRRYQRGLISYYRQRKAAESGAPEEFLANVGGAANEPLALSNSSGT